MYSLVNYLWDRAAANFGWWIYPTWTESGQFPVTGYLLAGLVGGGAFGLAGRHIIRHWQWKGFAGYLLFWAAYAIIHDYGGALVFASSRLMVFGAGLIPILADVPWYVSGNALPPIIIWLIGNSLNRL